MSLFISPLSEVIWDVKYRYRLQGKIIDQTIEQTWLRVAKAIAKAEAPGVRRQIQDQFYSILENFQFLPGGRILAGAGTHRAVTLLNCFVMPLGDSLKNIFDALKEGALTLQAGGGVGYDFSSLRPRGSRATHTGSVASGPVSFMRIWDAMCATMQSTGARRGAMMGILQCDHPDIEEFVTAKLDPVQLRHFNVSVLVTDQFMHAVKNNLDWELIFPNILNQAKKINARTLWHTIIKSAYEVAEPGVLFKDTINRQNNLWYKESISATNPCGEIPLPSYGACDLGAINLTQFVLNPFAENAAINWQKLQKTTEIATRFLDNVIDVSKYPLAAQKQQAHNTRRIGLGITGLADMLIMLGVQYGSEQSFKLAQDVMRLISETTWYTSIELAKEKGVFPLFDAEKYLQGEFVKNRPHEILQEIAVCGIRNSHHNTIAPTGTISLLANNISNGMEPVFSACYDRHVRLADTSVTKFSVKDYAISCWQTRDSKEKLPPAWVDAQSLHPLLHLKMQAALQPYIDNAISKTINIPSNYPFEELLDVYSQAYEMGLKGCTIFRPNRVTGSVLEITNSDTADSCCIDSNDSVSSCEHVARR